MNVLRIFLASPGDVQAEREMIFNLKDDLDIIIGKQQNIKFEIVNWERNTYPGIGTDAQAVINDQIKDDYDIFIGIFWQRFGTPTSRYESGTEEEFIKAKTKYSNNPEMTHILMYFKTQEVDMYKIDIEQFQKVKKFRDRISTDDGVYYRTFERTDELKNLLQIHLSTLIADKFTTNKEVAKNSLPEKQEPIAELDKYELLARRIEENDTNLEIENLVENIEMVTGSLGDLTNCTNKITMTMNFFAERTNERTSQFKRVSNIKDDRLKLSRAKSVSNEYSSDLDKYSQDLETILPEYRDALDNCVKSYTEIIYKTINSFLVAEEEKESFLVQLPTFISSVDSAIEGTAGFLEIFTETNINLTQKLSTAKRRAELATNNIFKELIRTKKLLQELEDNI